MRLRPAPISRLHPESILRLPLVAQMYSDPRVDKLVRAIDAEWFYKHDRLVPKSVVGFNPYRSTLYFGTGSESARWWPHAAGSARRYNEGDVLLKEILFATHDYLHVWAYHLIAALEPKRGFGHAAITPSNFEEHVFCHLLTETVATVGVDYWYLSTVELDQVCPIGSASSTGLTTAYHERYRDEYRRGNPALQVQAPAFFEILNRFYCTGVLPGFGPADLRRSPRILQWLRHELSYGELQRRYAREWFSFLAAKPPSISQGKLAAPCVGDAPWQRRLVVEVGRQLWRKVKEGVDEPPPRPRHPAWASPPSRKPDHRFLTLGDQDATPTDGERAPNWLAQRLARRPLAKLASRLGHLRFAAEHQRWSLCAHLTEDVEPLPRAKAEPRDLFMIG